MSIIILVHDVGWNEVKEPDINMLAYRKFHAKFANKKIPYSVAVIPAIVDYDMRQWMCANFYNGVTTILHGWNHENNLYNGKSDEFGIYNFIQKRKRIELGVKWLADLHPRGFCAPFNRYNDDLLSACLKNGLRYFFGGYGREKTEVFEEKLGMQVIPVDGSLYMRGSDFKNKIDIVKNLPDRELPYVVTFHCTWEYGNLDNPLFDELIDAIQFKQVISVETL